MKLVEQYAGVGTLRWRDRSFARVPYRINRFQGLASSGLPVPGLHRIEGSIDLDEVEDAASPAEHSRVAIDIEPIGDMVRLTVTDMRRMIESGWPRVLSSLKSFLETGRPLDTWV